MKFGVDGISVQEVEAIKRTEIGKAPGYDSVNVAMINIMGSRGLLLFGIFKKAQEEIP